MKRIYIELVFLDNFCMDFILLYSVLRLCHDKIVFKQICFGGLIGATYSVLSLFLPWASSLPLRIIVSLLLLMPLGIKAQKQYWKRAGVFYAVSFIFSGAMYLVASVLGGNIQNGVLYMPAFRYVLIGLSLGLMLLEIFIRSRYPKIGTNYILSGSLCGEAFSLPAYMDTGNKLVDIHGNGVIVVNKHILLSQFSPSLQAKIESKESDLQMQLFLIQTVAGEDYIDSVYADSLTLSYENQEYQIQAYLALVEQGTEKKALLSPNIILIRK